MANFRSWRERTTRNVKEIPLAIEKGWDSRPAKFPDNQDAPIDRAKNSVKFGGATSSKGKKTMFNTQPLVKDSKLIFKV